MIATIVDEFPQVCRDCGEILDVIEQPRFNGGVIQLVTCWEKGCLLHAVTLSVEQYNNLSEVELQAYRDMNTKRAGEAS